MNAPVACGNCKTVPIQPVWLPEHFLVHGERGIGKTSLLDYVKYLANGDIDLPDEDRFKFLTVSIDLGGYSTGLEIIRKLGRGFRSELRQNNKIQEKAKNVGIGYRIGKSWGKI